MTPLSRVSSSEVPRDEMTIGMSFGAFLGAGSTGNSKKVIESEEHSPALAGNLKSAHLARGGACARMQAHFSRRTRKLDGGAHGYLQ